MKAKKPVKHIFVVGCPRSGGTWTALLLACHPAIVAAPQTRLFLALAQLEEWWQRNCSSLFSIFGVGFEGLGLDAAKARSRSARLMTRDEFLNICRHFATAQFDKIITHKPGAEFVVEQTPEHINVAPLILAVLPDAYILHVIRDPRSVYASLYRAARSWAPEFPRDRVSIASMWPTQIALGRSLAERTDRYLELRYEALKDHGAVELKRVFDWLELPADAELCERAVESCRIEKIKKKGKAPDGFFRRGSTDWESELSRSEIKLVEYCSKDLMEKLGYPRKLPNLRGPDMHTRLHNARTRFARILNREQRKTP